MARTRNPVETTKVQLSTTPQVVRALEVLAKTGMFGKNAAEVAEELMRQKLREVIHDGWAERRVAK